MVLVNLGYKNYSGLKSMVNKLERDHTVLRQVQTFN